MAKNKPLYTVITEGGERVMYVPDPNKPGESIRTIVGETIKSQLQQKSTNQQNPFDKWYSKISKKHGLNSNPDDPKHYYDYRAAFDAGVKGPDKSGHWPSKYKTEGHPQEVVKGVNTRTGKSVAKIINQVAEELLSGNDEFKLALHAIALAESGGRADAIGDQGSSIGVFQNNMAGGRGAGHTKENLLDAEYNIRLAADDLVKHYQNAKAQGLGGAAVASYMSQYGQRPAEGLWVNAANNYGKTVGDVPVGTNEPHMMPDATMQQQGPEKPKGSEQNLFEKFMDWVTPDTQAAERQPYETGRVGDVSISKPKKPSKPKRPKYERTVEQGDTLWGIAEQVLGSGFRWKELQGYKGDPRQMPIGTQISYQAPKTQQQQRRESGQQAFQSLMKPTSFLKPKFEYQKPFWMTGKLPGAQQAPSRSAPTPQASGPAHTPAPTSTPARNYTPMPTQSFVYRPPVWQAPPPQRNYSPAPQTHAQKYFQTLIKPLW